MPQNRKLQNFVESKYIASAGVESTDMADESIFTDALQNDAVTNAKTDVHHLKTIKVQWDFVLDGGDNLPPFLSMRAATTETASLPADALVVGAYMEVVAAPTSAGAATIQFGTLSNDDAFIGATAYNNAAFALNALSSLSGDMPFKVLAEDPIIINIGVADLTAGTVNLFIEYYEGGSAGF